MYVPVIDGLIVMSNPVSSFSAGQFGFTSTFRQPPIVLPRSPMPTSQPGFAAEPTSDIASRTDDAFSALGYAGGPMTPSHPITAPARPGRDWNAWINVGGGDLKVRDASGSGNAARGEGLDIFFGLGRQIAPDTLVGVLAGYERFNYDVATLAASARYDGHNRRLWFSASAKCASTPPWAGHT